MAIRRGPGVMRNPLSEHEVLAFIEDEMSPKKRLSFAARLERDPGLRERIERMRADRAALRALPEPELPVDFLAALEPQLARPMLVSSTVSSSPGAYRRRHRRSMRHKIGRLAIAAVFAAALFGGVWGATVLLPRVLRAPALDVARGGGSRTRDVPETPAREMARRAGGTSGAAQTGSPEAGETQGADEPWPPRDAIVHHRAPLPPRVGAGAVTIPITPTVVAATVIPEAPLALVVPASDAAEGEALVRRVVAEIALPAGANPRRTRDIHGAVVRNFSMDEARRLVQRLERDRISAGGGAPRTIAGVDGVDGTGSGPAARQRVIARLRRLDDRTVDADPRASARLLGPADLAPDFERQLELSSLGATHTVTLPVDLLAEFLGRLRVAEGRETSIRPLSPGADAGPRDARTELQRWVENHAAIRDFAAALGGTPGEGYVMLPVVVEVRDDS